MEKEEIEKSVEPQFGHMALFTHVF